MYCLGLNPRSLASQASVYFHAAQLPILVLQDLIKVMLSFSFV